MGRNFLIWLSLLVGLSQVFAQEAPPEAAKGPVTFVITDMEGLLEGFRSTPSDFGSDFGPDLGGEKFAGGGAVGQSEVYRRILQEFGPRHQEIGKEHIKESDGLSVGGGINHVGISYTHDFIDFSVDLKREIAPDLFHDTRFIVVDNFHIVVDATKFLGNLQDRGVVDLSEDQFAAFTGITFKRSYRYAHFAPDFKSALQLHLDKLFLGFRIMEENRYGELLPDEFISRKDSMSVHAGIAAGVSAGYGLSGEFGMFAKYHRLSTAELQGIGGRDRLRVSFEKERGKSVMGRSALQLDFFRLLQITLFSMEFEYSYFEQYRAHLKFDQEGWNQLINRGNPLSGAVADLLRTGDRKNPLLDPYITSYEQHQREVQKSKYAALVLGASKECQTSNIRVADEGKIKTFFRHSYERVRYKEGFFSRLMALVMKSFLRLDSVVKKQVSDSKSVCIEYESEKNLIKEREDLLLPEGEEKLTLKFQQRYYSHEFDQDSRDRCVATLEACSDVKGEVVDAIKQEEFKGPVKLKTNLIINRKAIDYFNQLSINQVYDVIAQICPSTRGRSNRRPSRSVGRNSGRRRGTGMRSRRDSCKNELRRAYNNYFKELIFKDYTAKGWRECASLARELEGNSETWQRAVDTCMQRNSLKKSRAADCEIPLWRLKDFVDKLHSRAKEKAHLFALFGDENVFMHGSIEGQLASGKDFTTCFQEGEFSGSGPVDSYLRERNLHSSDSLLLED